jgi:hypothetical protein
MGVSFGRLHRCGGFEGRGFSGRRGEMAGNQSQIEDESKPPVTGPAPAGRFVFEEDGMSRECGSARLDLVTPLATSAKRTVCSGTAG